MVGRGGRLQNVVFECRLEVLYSVVLLSSQETVAPRVGVYHREYVVLLGGSDEVVEVFEAWDE